MAIYDGRTILLAAAIVLAARSNWCPAQAPRAKAAPAERASTWRAPEERAAVSADRPAASGDRAAPQTSASRPGETAANVDPIEPLKPITESFRRSIAKVTHGIDSLPNEHGQVWRTYDISPYTLRVISTSHPEQAIVDWVLRETGYEAWHSEAVTVLSPTIRELRVYHTPEIQAVVSEVVDRFVNTEAESYAFSLRVVTVGNPNWRAKALPMLRPLEVESQGVQAWLLAKEDAALLQAELRKRTDYREHSSPQLLVSNGQATTVAATRSKTYVRDVQLRGDVWPGFESMPTQINEGFSLEFSPLLSLNRQTIDAVVKCNIDQVEKLIPVFLEVPTPVAPRQRAQIEVPQITQCRLHERFRFPSEHVLLVGLGVVAMPVPTDPNPILKNLPWMGGPSRADLLVFIENKGNSLQIPPAGERTGARDANSSRGGRY